MEDDAPEHRALAVPTIADGMRLDVFLARRFADRSRTWIAAGIRAGQVRTDAERPLRASAIVRAGQTLHLYLDGIAPSGPPPPFPTVLHDDGRVLALDKPAGLLTHPAGTDYAWSVVALARARWPDRAVDLVHRLDRDTSGVQLLTHDMDANRKLKKVLHDEGAVKEYLALCKGHIPWDTATLDQPLGPADGPIRIQQAVRADGLHARTDVTVLGRHASAPLTLVRCRIHTGRTHQIRVHLSHAGFPLLGDRMYGVPVDVFLGLYDGASLDASLAQVGAPRQALHAEHMVVPHPAGGWLDVRAPMAPDMAGWWADPSTLPWEGVTERA